MKRIAALAFLILLAACGSDTAPTDRFSGTWAGSTVSGTDTLHVVLVSSQTGSAVSGTGTASDSASSAALTFSGTSTPPSVSLLIISPFDSATYNGTFVSSDSVVGVISGGGTSSGLSLKRQ
jgi:type 1 fimbria pilin